MLHQHAAATAILATLLCTCALAQQQPAQPITVQPRAQAPASDQIIIRTYNVSDLLRLTSDYPLDSAIRPPTSALRGPAVGAQASKAGGGGGQALFSGDGVVVGTRPKEPAIEIDPLTRLIIDTVQPETWKDNGGQIGSIHYIGSLLIVTQTAASHETIQKLLDEIRGAAGPTQIVSVRLTWLEVTRGDGPAPTTNVSDDWFGKQRVYCESRLTCFSGQTVHISSGQGRLAVTDATPIVGTDAVAFDPILTPMLSGVALQIAPQLIPGSDSAILDVQASVSEDAPAEPAVNFGAIRTPENQPVTQALASIDRVHIRTQEFKTTTRLQLSKRTIIGGMTLDPSSGEGDKARQLYLVAQVDAVK